MLASSHRHAVQAGLQRVLGCQMSPMAAALLATRRAVAAASAAPGDNSGSGDAGGSAGAVIAPPNIPKLAQMAQISVTEEEVKDWEPKIGSIVDWFGQLQAVDVAGVSPAVHVRDEGNVARPDEPAVYANREALMNQVPDAHNGFVRVPKIATGADSSSSSSSATASSTASSTDDESAAASTGAAAISEAELAALQALDLRVGRIISCEPHPDAESLYVSQIDVGEPEPRTIVSGLAKYVPLEQMADRSVIALCNLKARNMRGIKSNGMLLAASNDSHDVVEPLAPAPGAAPGSRVWFGQHAEQAAPMEPNPLAKKKVWEGVQPVLRTDGQRVASFKGAAMRTAEGPVTCGSLTAARIG